jgi:hypothetical protein
MSTQFRLLGIEVVYAYLRAYDYYHRIIHKANNRYNEITFLILPSIEI